MDKLPIGLFYKTSGLESLYRLDLYNKDTCHTLKKKKQAWYVNVTLTKFGHKANSNHKS